MANFTSKLSNLRCFEAFYAAFVLTNFCWRDRCKFEAWLNFLLGWRAYHFFRAFGINFVKKADMTAQSMRDCIKNKEPYNRCIVSEKFS
ncbi:hypothetical protein [Campylobacter concisus]|uniref:hypothetical protein n=1 Tax=Campylobacter concisus TaxID=199 RepID=UPI000CD98909|nr:hypothetical protein [Campylobacter concisus]